MLCCVIIMILLNVMVKEYSKIIRHFKPFNKQNSLDKMWHTHFLFNEVGLDEIGINHFKFLLSIKLCLYIWTIWK